MGGRSCANSGGCPSDYIAIAIAILSLLLLFTRAIVPFLLQNAASVKANGFWLIVVQVIASINLTFSLVMSTNLIELSRKRSWQSCYIWAVWLEGPFGFGLLMSSRIVQAYQLYHVFVKRCLPPVKPYVLLPLIVLPWICSATFIHLRKPLNHMCQMRRQWVIPLICIHGVYVASLIGFTVSVRNVEFRFHEFKDLLKGIIASTISIGLWVTAYIVNEVHEDISWVEVSSRFLLLLMTSILVLVFFSMSVSQPLLSQISLRRRETLEVASMSQALGIPESELLMPTTAVVGDLNQPLDQLLTNRRFRRSFMAFADSCLAGESVHFFEEAYELSKIPLDDPVRRLYMSRHIIEKYIITGAEMEINISYKTRQEILATLDLAHPDLFDHALREVIQLMKMNLAKDYWSSIYSARFKDEPPIQFDSYERNGRDSPPRLSCVHCTDDPFHQGNMHRCPSQRDSDMIYVDKH